VIENNVLKKEYWSLFSRIAYACTKTWACFII